MLNEFDISAILVTIKLAAISTLILLLIGSPIAWWLSQTKFKFKAVFEAIIALPLVLPPTVLGFYLLITLGSNGPIGKFLESIGGTSMAFTFSGLVVGSVIYSMPFVVQPLQNSFSVVGRRPMEIAAYCRRAISSLWFYNCNYFRICSYSRRVWRCSDDRWKYSWRNWRPFNCNI